MSSFDYVTVVNCLLLKNLFSILNKTNLNSSYDLALEMALFLASFSNQYCASAAIFFIQSSCKDWTSLSCNWCFEAITNKVLLSYVMNFFLERAQHIKFIINKTKRVKLVRIGIKTAGTDKTNTLTAKGRGASTLFSFIQLKSRLYSNLNGLWNDNYYNKCKMKPQHTSWPLITKYLDM